MPNNMDYKYIEQLLERYWQCMTTLEEEKILRAFFSQDEIPADLLVYRPIFLYQQSEVAEDVLGDDFDERMLELTGLNAKQPKARTFSLTQRLMPFFRAAAIVAIILTLGNALQVAFEPDTSAYQPNTAVMPKPAEGPSVALGDSTTVKMDTIQPAILPAAVLK